MPCQGFDVNAIVQLLMCFARALKAQGQAAAAAADGCFEQTLRWRLRSRG